MAGGIRVVAAVVLALAPVVARGAHTIEQQIKVDLAVEIQTRDGRDFPVFTVTVKNVSDSPVSIIDVRTDVLRRWLRAPIEVASLDPTISTLGPNPDFFDQDFFLITLEPGEGIEYTDERDFYSSPLPRGRYRAQIRYSSHPLESPNYYESPVIEFEILNAPPPSESSRRPPTKTEMWTTYCGPTIVQTICIMSYRPAGSEISLPRTWAIFLWSYPEPAFVVAQSAQCPDHPVRMRVDENRVIPIPFDGSHELTGDAAKHLFDVLRTGEVLTLWVHLSPDCAERKMRIPLAGFASAWGEFKAGLAE